MILLAQITLTGPQIQNSRIFQVAPKYSLFKEFHTWNEKSKNSKNSRFSKWHKSTIHRMAWTASFMPAANVSRLKIREVSVCKTIIKTEMIHKSYAGQTAKLKFKDFCRFIKINIYMFKEFLVCQVAYNPNASLPGSIQPKCLPLLML